MTAKNPLKHVSQVENKVSVQVEENTRAIKYLLDQSKLSAGQYYADIPELEQYGLSEDMSDIYKVIKKLEGKESNEKIDYEEFLESILKMISSVLEKK
jgi:phosphoribosylanthranilate isomerase